MKRKYRVQTDNLDWIPIKRNDIISIECKFKSINFIAEVRDNENNILLDDCLLLMDKHPEWFSEIKEDKEELIDHRIKYSEADMLAFGETVKSKYDFNNQNATVRGLFNSYKAAKFSPKEEQSAPPIEFKGMRMSENERIAWEILNPAVKEIALRFKKYSPKEEDKEFTRDDVITFACYYRDQCTKHTVIPTAISANAWLDRFLGKRE